MSRNCVVQVYKDYLKTLLVCMFYLCDLYESQVDTVHLETGYSQERTVNCQNEVIISITIVNRLSPS